MVPSVTTRSAIRPALGRTHRRRVWAGSGSKPSERAQEMAACPTAKSKTRTTSNVASDGTEENGSAEALSPPLDPPSRPTPASTTRKKAIYGQTKKARGIRSQGFQQKGGERGRGRRYHVPATNGDIDRKSTMARPSSRSPLLPQHRSWPLNHNPNTMPPPTAFFCCCHHSKQHIDTRPTHLVSVVDQRDAAPVRQAAVWPRLRDKLQNADEGAGRLVSVAAGDRTDGIRHITAPL